MSNSTIIVEALTKKFDKFTAVDQVSFQVEEGEIFALLGANGAGKSTTIRMLCGILPPTAGSGSVAGYSISDNAGLVRQNIGYMSQKFSLYEELTVYENMKFFAKLYSVSACNINKRLSDVINLVNLNGFEKIKAKSLSAGIKQRLSLACAIIHNPKVLFLDEPTSGIDPISRRNFWDLIYSFAEEKITIFVTTHYMDEAEYCDKIALMGNGLIKAIGTPEELKTNKLICDVWKIEGADLYAIANILQSTEGVFDVGLLSDVVRVLAHDLTVEDIEKNLKNNGVSEFKAERVPATLEDVFVNLSGRNV